MGSKTNNSFFFNSTFMANNQQLYRGEHKQRSGDGMAFHNSGINMQLFDFKRVNKMAQVKMIWLICDIFGIPITCLGIVANIDNIKSVILAILGIAYLMVRGYYFMVQKEQAVREKELDLWHREMDKEERIKKMSKTE